MEQKIRIIHACPWDLLKKIVKTVLDKRSDIEYAGSTTNGQELIEMVRKNPPNLILMDISLSAMPGIDALAIIKQEYPHVKVIMLTLHNDASTILQALRFGASGFVTSDADSAEILNAIDCSNGPGVFLSNGAKQALCMSPKLPSKKHLWIMRALADNLTEERIAEEVDLTVRTVRAIIDKLLREAGVSTVEELVDYAKRNGFVGA